MAAASSGGTPFAATPRKNAPSLAHDWLELAEHRSEIADEKLPEDRPDLLVSRRGDLDDFITRVAERGACVSDGLGDFRIGRGAGRLGNHRNRNRRSVARSVERGIKRPGITGVDAAKHAQGDANVRDAPRHG